MYVHTCVYGYLQKPKEGTGLLGDGVTGACESPYVVDGAVIQTLVFMIEL